MNPRRTVWLFVILLAIAAGVLWYESTLKTNVSNQYQRVDLFAGIDTSAIQRIQVSSKPFNITLAKEAGGWMIREPYVFPASERSIQNFLRVFERADAATRVSLKEQYKTRFQVDDTSGVRVTVTHDGQTTRFTLGKFGDEYLSNFITLQDRKGIWKLHSPLLKAILPRLDQWIRKKAFSLPWEAIRAMLIQYPAGEYSFRMEGDTWIMQTPVVWRDLDPKDMKSLVGHFMLLNIASVPLEDPGTRSLQAGDGRAVLIRLGNMGNLEEEILIDDQDRHRNPLGRVGFSTRPVRFNGLQLVEIKKLLKEIDRKVKDAKKTDTSG